MPRPTMLLAAAAIGLALVSLYLTRELSVAREEARALQTRIGELEAQSNTRPGSAATAVGQVNSTWQPQQLPPWPSANRAAVAMHDVQVAATASTGSEMSEELRSQLRKSFEQQRSLLQDPEYRAALIEQQKQGLWQTHPNLREELGLTDARIDQLFTLLAEQQLGMSDNMETRFSAEPPDPAQIEQMSRKMLEEQERNEREVADLLGPKYQAWKDYQATLGARFQADDLRDALAQKRVPLDDAQWKQLVKALAAQQQALTNVYVSDVGFGAKGTAIAVLGSDPTQLSAASENTDALQLMAQHNERQRAALEGILTAEQLRVIDERQALAMKLMRAHQRVAEKVGSVGR